MLAIFHPGLAWPVQIFVRAIIFGVVFRIIRFLPLWTTLLLLALIVVGIVYWTRNRRGWY